MVIRPAPTEDIYEMRSGLDDKHGDHEGQRCWLSFDVECTYFHELREPPRRLRLPST